MSCSSADCLSPANAHRFGSSSILSVLFCGFVLRFCSDMTRRQYFKASLGLLGLTLADVLGLRRRAISAESSFPGFGRAKRCIVLFCWGGMSHLDTWDPKPNAPSEVRGEFGTIRTATPGIRISEHMPRLARQTERLAIIRSMHHGSSAHGRGMYWNMTGHAPPQEDVAGNLPPAPSDWPSLGAVVSKLKTAPRGLPGAVRLPYPLVDNGTLQAGEYAGWLGMEHDPIVLMSKRGKAFGGVSRPLGAAKIDFSEEIDRARLRDRLGLLDQVEQPVASGPAVARSGFYRELATDMLLNPRVQAAFDVDREPSRVHEAYGEHICGQSMILARRMSEVGVPVVTVACSAGDLNGSVGDHWDTHGNNFNRLKNTMLPVFDRAASALLDDLEDRGMLDETLVVLLTEFGRTPRINRNAGRDHFPSCYSVALAGGGIRGGQVYGESDRIGATPASDPATPADLHATIFSALGLSPATTIVDPLGRPFPIADGRPLPLT